MKRKKYNSWRVCNRSLTLRVRKLSLQNEELASFERQDEKRSSKTKIVKPETGGSSALDEPELEERGVRGRRRVLYPIRVTPLSGTSRTVSQPKISTGELTFFFFFKWFFFRRQIMLTVAHPGNTGRNLALARAVQSRGRSASPASPASPSPVRPNRTSALRQTTTQKSRYPSTPALDTQTTSNNPQVRLRSSSRSPRSVNSAPVSPRQVTTDDIQPGSKRQSLDGKTVTVSKSDSPPQKATNADPLHPSIASMGKQGTFTKEKSTSPETGAIPPEEVAKVPPKVPPKPKPKADQVRSLEPTGMKPALPKKPSYSRINVSSPPVSTTRTKGSPALSRRSVRYVSFQFSFWPLARELIH